MRKVGIKAIGTEFKLLGATSAASNMLMIPFFKGWKHGSLKASFAEGLNT